MVKSLLDAAGLKYFWQRIKAILDEKANRDEMPDISVKTNSETEYTLTISDQNGVIETPNLKGSSGVYVGSGDMPEGYNIQIDLDDEDVPLVKIPEQPDFVDDINKMTDITKVYVMPDGLIYGYIKGKLSHRLGTDRFTYAQVNTDGSLMGGFLRIASKELIPLSSKTISIHCPSPYQYFIYFYSDNDVNAYIGKSANWKSGSVDNIFDDEAIFNEGMTIENASFCRISLRDATSSSSLRDRLEEFLENVIIAETGDEVSYGWRSTGLAYNQPAQYEDRIVALEQALEGIEYGSY